MKLGRAYICVQCDEIFEKPLQECCPSCTNRGIMSLAKILPAMSLEKGVFKVNLNAHGFEKVKDILSSSGKTA